MFKPSYRVDPKILCVSFFIGATEILEISTFCRNIDKQLVQISGDVRFIFIC